MVTEETAAAEETQAVVENVVTFEVGEGAAVTVDGVDATNATAMAKDGTIYFVVTVAEGYELAEVLVDGSIPARTTENAGEYIIENIKTDETVVSVSTTVVETEEEIIEEEILDDGVMMAADDEGVELYAAASKNIADSANTVTYTYRVNGQLVELGPNDTLQVQREDTVTFVMTYTFGEANMPTKSDCTGYYFDIPANGNLTIINAETGNITDDSDNVVGTYRVDKESGRVYFDYDPDWVDGKTVMTGTFNLRMQVNKAAAADDSTIDVALPGKEGNVTVNLGGTEVTGAKSYVIDEETGELIFTVELEPDSADINRLVITDTLTGNLQFTGTEDFIVKVGDTTITDAVVVITENNQKATITLPSNTVIHYGEKCIVTYRVKAVPGADGSVSGGNTAGWGWGDGTGDGTGSGTGSDALDTPINVNLVGNVLSKTGAEMSDNQIKYTIKVNELKANLIDPDTDKDTIILKDIIDSNVTLLQDTIVIVDENGITYGYSYDPETRLLLIELPDETRATITYSVRVDGDINQEFDITNTVSIDGKGQLTSSTSNHVKIQESDASISAREGALRIVKTRKYAVADKSAYMENVEFKLFKLDHTQAVDANTEGTPIQLKATNANGILVFGKDTTQGYDALELNTLYYVQEISTETGYILDQTKHYFVLNADDTFKAAVATNCSSIANKISYLNDGSAVMELSNDSIPAKVDVNLTAGKTVDGEAPEAGETFQFKIERTSNEGPAFVVDGNTVTSTTVTSNGETVTFPTLTFTSDDKGNFCSEATYKISEVKGTGNYIYDETVYTVKLTIGRNSVTGDLEVKSKEINGTVTTAPMTFNNITTTGFTLEKDVETKVNRDTVFNFTVSGKKDGAAVDLTDVAVTGAEGTVTNNGSSITLNVKVAANKEKSDKVTFTGIPVGTVITVTENLANNAGWTLKFNTAAEGVTLVEGEKKAVVVTNDYDASGSWTPKATKILTGRTLKAGEFKFEVKDSIGTVIMTGTNDASGNVSFTNASDGKVNYTLADVKNSPFIYTVSEKVETAETGMTYDTTVYTVTVSLTDNGDGTLNVNAVYSGGTATDKAAFKNKYEAQGSWTPTASKAMTGGAQYNDTTFTFSVYQGANKVSTGTVNKNSADGAIEFTPIQYTQSDIGATYTYIIKEDTPASTDDNYRADINYDTTQYTVTVIIGDLGNGSVGPTSVQYVKNNSNAVTAENVVFTNSYRAEGQGTIKGSKTLANKELGADDFTFGLFYDSYGQNPVKVNAAGYIDANGTQLTTTNLAPEAGQTYGKFVLNTPVYTQADISTTAKEYWVFEINDHQSGITYDARGFQVLVTVSDAGNGALNVSTSYPSGSIKFENTYDAEGKLYVSAKKTIDGQNTIPNKFSFVLTDSEGEVLQRVTNSGANVTFKPISYTMAQVPNGSAQFVYYLEEEKGTDSFYTYSTEKYQIIATVTDNGTGTFEVSHDVKKLDEHNNYVDYEADGTHIPLFTNEYTAEGSVTISGKKVLQNRNLTAGKFKFELYELVGYDPAEGTYTARTKVGSTVSNDANGNFSFSAIAYNEHQTGTHYYAVHEVDNGGHPGYTYQSEDVLVTVNVTDNGNGTLTAVASPNGTEGDAALTVTNTYHAAGSLTLNAHKTLNGRTLAAGQFSFELKDSEGKVLQTKTNDASGAVTFDALSYSEQHIGGPYTYTISEVIPNPKASGYTYSEVVYTVTVNVTDNGDGTLNTPYTITKSGSEYKNEDGTPKTPEFVNTYEATGHTSFSGTKKLDGGSKALAAGDFKFQLYAVVNGKEVPMKDTDGEDIIVPNDADGLFTFPEIYYDESDVNTTFVYRIREVNEGKPGYTYDSSYMDVTVTLTDNEDGTLTANKVINKTTGTGSATVTAIEFVNTYEARGSITPMVTKVLTGRALEDQQFTFEMTGDTFTGKKTAKNDGNGNVIFETLSYTQEDIGETYTYVITEKSENAAGYTYSNAVYKFVVSVTDNNGELKAEGKYYDSTDTELTNPIAQPTFTNTYGAGTSVTFEGTKKLTGNRTLDKEQFSFLLTDEEGNEIETVKNNADGSFKFKEISYTQDDVDGLAYKDFVYYVSEVEVEGDTVYDYDKTVYKVTVRVTDNGNGTLTAQTTILNQTTDEEDDIEFTNHYNAYGELTLNAVKTLNTKSDQISVKADQFEFELAGAGITTQVKKNDAEGKVAFDTIEYDETDIGKTYLYTVAEHAGTQGGFEYSNEIYIVRVDITDNRDGSLNVKETIIDRYGNEVKKDNLGFINTYHANGSVELDALKILRGTELEAEQFAFELKDNTGNVLQTKKNNADGTVVFETIAYDESAIGTHTYTINEVIPEEIPEGYTYDETVYTVTVTVSDNGDGTLKTEKKVTKPDVNDQGEDVQIIVKNPEFVNVYRAACSVPVTAKKVLSGTALEDGQFWFSLISQGDAPKVEREVSNVGSIVSFGELQYTEADAGKTYTYLLREVIPNPKAAGYTYDEQVYQVVVSIEDDGDGTMTATPTIYKVTGPAGDPQKEIVTEAVFSNEYHAAGKLNLTATKVLTGRDLEEGQFTFTLENAEGTPEVSDEQTNDANGLVVFNTIEYTEEDAGQTYTYTVKETNAGEAGYTYDETVYTVTAYIKDNGDGTLTPDVTIKAGETEVDGITFNNVYEAKGEILLTATKNLEGRKIENNQFEFKLSGQDIEDQTKKNSGTNVTFDVIEYTIADAGKDYTYTISEVIPADEDKIPGYSYDTTTYEVNVSVRDNGDGSLDVTKEITKISVTDEGTVRTEADAVEFNNTYKVECELNLTATKKLTGRDLEAEQFTFTLTNGENTPAVSQEKTNSADGEVVFDAIKYTEADAGNTYTYTVKESVPANKAAGYTYDETEYTVTVTINDDGEGTLTPEVVINDGAVTAIEFENTYKAEGKIQLTATKNLEGRAIADNQFEFMLSGQDIEAQTKRNDGTTVTFDEIIYGEEDAGKDFVYTISEVIPDVKAPGYSYDETEYKVTVSVSDNGDGTLEAKVTKITLADKEVDAVVFNNTYVAEGELELTATKALSGRTIENGQFKFSLKGIGNEGDTNADQEVSNIGNTVTFAKLKYTQKDAGKTYVYRMQEVIPEEKAAGYVYDESVYQVEVSVTDNGNGTVTAVPTFYKITGTAADPKKDEVDGAVFNNEYHAAGELNLTATKALAGRDLEAEQFTFTLESGENTPAFSQEKTNNAAGVITFDTIKYTEEDAGKTYTYTVQEIDAEADGYTYDETVYTVTVKVKDNGDGTLTPVVKYEADETETDAIRFSNTYEAGGEIILTATKNLEGRKIADGQFKFKLVGPNTDEQIKSNVGTNVTFDAIEYSEVDAGKDYVYTISEVIPDVKAPGYTYDETTYKVTVSVRDNGDGTLDAKVTKITAADEVVDAVEFNNIYEAKGDITLTAEKILKGRAIEDGQFKFSLKGINNEGDTNADQEVSNVGETVTFGKLEYTEKDAGKTYTYELQEVIPADEDKAPGYTYDTTVYTVTIDVTDNGNGTLKVEKTISTPGENEAITVENAVFQNEYNAEGGITLEAEKKYAEGVQKDLEDGRFEFVVTENGEEVASASNAGGKVVFTEIEYVLTPDDQSVLGTHTYVVTEVAGTETTVYYDDAEYTVTVEVTDNGDGTLKSEITDITCDEETKDDITFVNDVTKVRISKTDIMNSEELPGAELEVRDAEGVVIDSWTSGTETHYIEDVLEIGKIYTLVETAAPDGYTIANEMQFYVAEDGLVYTADDELIADGTVVMEDEPIRIEITKTGFTKDGEVVPLQGAKMEIREKTEAGEIGDIVYNVYGEKMRFESATEAVALNGVKPGTYWLVELEAPEGYMLADPIEFTINEDMTVSQNPATRVMKDCPIVVEISKVDITNNEELPGAKLQVLDKDGKQVVKTIYGEELSWTSTSTPRTFTGLPAGDYILREIAAPDGYALAKDVAFTITSDLTVVNKVVMEDAPTEVVISKTKLTGTKELEGAQLQVLDATGKVAKTIYGEELSWTSGQTAKEIKGLPTGTYTLHEVLPPEGYAYAEDITFEVTNDGAVTKLVMKDDTTKVTISKMDVTNNKELAGAHLILKDAQGEIVAEWTSTGKPKELNGKLIAGAEYTLTEITAPVGYDIAKDITFTVNTDGTINKVVMDDKVSDGKGSVTVQKLVMQDGNFFAVDYTFYTALFADEACTQRVTSVKPLIVNGSYTTSTIFTNLQYGTYYVAETDEYGNAISEALMIESIDIIDGTAVLTPAQATAKSTIINHVAGFDGGYYNDGQIKVNKTVLVNGVEEKVTDTFYFALFTDAGLTMMYDAGVQKLKLKNESAGSVTFKNLPYGSYYLAETDKNGNPVDADFEYTVTISSSYCSLDAENRTVERDVINSKVEQPDGTTTTTTTTTTGTTTSTTSTGATTTTSVKTGDETPVAPYAAAMALSAAVLALVSLMEKKRRRSR